MLEIIVPVYNESENIERLFDEISVSVKSEKRVSVIYDFDEDNTLPVIDKTARNYAFEIRKIKSDFPGVINAIKKGFASAESEKVLVVMADLSDRLDVVDEMARKMDEGFDLVCGSRYMRGGKQNGGPLLKNFLSRAAGISLHFLTGIPTHDATNSFKLYSKSLLENIKIESSGGFEIGLEIAVKAYAGGFKIAEVPSEWFERENGKSNFHLWRWLPHYLKWYFYCVAEIHARKKANLKSTRLFGRNSKR